MFNGHAQHLRSRLQLLPRYGIEPWIMTHRTGNLAAAETIDGVMVRRIDIPRPLSKRSILSEAALFTEFLRNRARYDLALLSSANVSGPFIRNVCRRPVIRESVIGEDHAGKFRPTLRGRAMEFVFRRVDFAVVVSPALQKAYLDVSWPKSRLSLIPYGVDCEFFRPPHSSVEIDRLRAELGLPVRPTSLFVTIGAVRQRKGHLDLVEAWASLPSCPPVHLVVIGPVGEPPYYEIVKKRILELGLEDRIHLVGRSDRIAEYLRCSDAFVFASSNEGLPISVIEAMASGLPVVAFDIEGILSFMIDDGRNGIIIPGRNRDALASAILGLSGNSTHRSRLGQAARTTARDRFSLEREAEAHANLYWAVYRRRAGQDPT